MKVLGCAVAMILLVGTTVFARGAFAQAKRDWTVYEPAGGGFRVNLPGKPAIKSGTTKSDYGPAKTTYASTPTDSDLACTARFTDYQPGATGSDPQVDLNRVKQNLAQFPQRSEERFKIGNASAIRFVMDLPDKSAKYESIILGDHTIVLACTFPKGQENSPDVSRVFKSLVLTKQ
jgi:hypothetical protein